jgi:zinc transport system substrate-binding protein
MNNNGLVRIVMVAATALVFSMVLAACTARETRSDKLMVYTTIFPVYDMARAVGGEDAVINILVSPGTEAHTFEPTPMDIARLEKADVFVYNGAHMEPWVDGILSGIKNPNLALVDTSKGITLLPAQGEGGGVDPHIWLDFDNAKKQIDTIAAAFILKDAVHEAGYHKRAEAYKKAFDELDTLYREGLSGCKDRVVILTGHFAFGYLAHRYNLTLISVFGLSPDAEPTPARISSVIETIKRNKAGYIFAEEMVEPRVAETIGAETGAKVLFVNAGHEIPREEFDRGITLVDLMKQNLTEFKRGLQCP